MVHQINDCAEKFSEDHWKYKWLRMKTKRSKPQQTNEKKMQEKTTKIERKEMNGIQRKNKNEMIEKK